MRRASAVRCWPSASTIAIQSLVAARMPVFTAAPLPLLYGCRTTRAPASAAALPVPSVEPSSMTSTSCHGAAAESAVTTPPMLAPSLNAGTTMVTDSGAAIALCCVPEVDDVAVLHHVFLAFEAQLAAVAAGGHRAARHERVVADDFGADESARDVAVNLPGRVERARAAADRPGAAFVLANGEKRHVAEQVVAGGNHAIEA